MATNNSPVCPYCHQSDQTQKVSSIILAGTTTGVNSTWDPKRGIFDQETTFTKSTTELVEALNRKAPPQYVQHYGDKPSMSRSNLYILMIVIAATVSACAITPSVGFGGTFFCLVIPAILAIGYIFYNSTDIDAKQAQLFEQFKQGSTAIQRAQQRWAELYYCHRDSHVFIPGEGRAFPLNQTEDLLYS